MKQARKARVRRLLSSPTAPLIEDHPAAAVEAWAEDEGLTASRDPAGNVVVRLDGEGQSPALVLVAHLDHPAFVVTDDAIRGETTALEFRGGVRAGFATVGTPVVFHVAASRRPVGRGLLRHIDEAGGSLRGASADIVSGRSVAGGFAMWDVGEVEIDDRTISGPVCDDLMGVAAIVCALHEAARVRKRPPRSVIGLCTRGEELGFLGALESIRLATAPRGSTVLSLECSKALPEAPQGGGVIVRVGDRSSVFDPGTTAGLSVAAASVATRSDAFHWQRRLMDGGACEATAFCAAGYRASGLALPLANYHNMPDEGTGIAAESVRVADFEAEVDLLLELIAHPEVLDPQPGRRRPAWFKARAAEARAALTRRPAPSPSRSQ